MKCATCKHWDTDLAEGDMFDMPTVPWKLGQCRLTLNKYDGSEVPAGGALALDCSGYRAILLTADEFGCLRWEALK